MLTNMIDKHGLFGHVQIVMLQKWPVESDLSCSSAPSLLEECGSQQVRPYSRHLGEFYTKATKVIQSQSIQKTSGSQCNVSLYHSESLLSTCICNSITGTHPGIMLVLGFPAKKRDTKLSKVGAKPQETDPPRQLSSMVPWWRLRQCSHGPFNVSIETMQACHNASVAFVDCISTGS